jgi:pyruvate-formate lyase-activating enzyme
MNLKLSTKTSNRLALMKAYLGKNPQVPGWPLTLTIESTAKCNLFCPMCMRQKIYFPPRDMDFSVFQKIIDEGRDFLEFAVPYGAGEPLLNPEIFDMISYCTKLRIPTGISTNGTLLSEEYSRKLIESGLSYITFAFDSTRKEVFETYRKGANFERVRDNIVRFLQVKKAMRSNIFCIVQMVALKDNQDEGHALMRMWKLDGVNAVRIKKDEVHNAESAIPGDHQKRPPRRHPCYLLWPDVRSLRWHGISLLLYLSGGSARKCQKNLSSPNLEFRKNRAHAGGPYSGESAGLSGVPELSRRQATFARDPGKLPDQYPYGAENSPVFREAGPAPQHIGF